MVSKNTKMFLAAALCAGLLAGCSTQGASETNSAPASSAPQSEPASSVSEAASQTAMPLDEQSDLAEYVQTLSSFFYTPVEDTSELPLDGYMGYFLVYQSFMRNGGSDYYTHNDQYFWEIPESDMQETAELYLGIDDISLSDITEWPFIAPQDGIYYYSPESSLPYSDTTVMEITADEDSEEIVVIAELCDSQYEDSSRKKTTLAYHFSTEDSADDKVIYQLESIVAQ